jgi:hypothetical protein
MPMPWEVEFHDDFVAEYQELPEAAQDELQALVQVLEILGPQMKRPRVDTLNGSRHKNMKELRFDACDGVWRFAFAFDLNRQAIILCGGDKSGSSEGRFYKRLIAKADARFGAHCKAIKKEKKQS